MLRQKKTVPRSTAFTDYMFSEKLQSYLKFSTAADILNYAAHIITHNMSQ